MLKGTQVLSGADAEVYRNVINKLMYCVSGYNYQEVVLPSLWNFSTFETKIVGQTLNQIWKFKDKADRDVCLVPEVTGMLQEMFNTNWAKEKPKPIRLFYVQKCFRYEKPQLGRLREFTQFGIELMTTDVTPAQAREVKEILIDCLKSLNVKNWTMQDQVKRGLGYYTEDGFEVECSNLGTQKQLAGGGRYAEGIGWAIGVERLMLALDGETSSAG